MRYREQLVIIRSVRKRTALKSALHPPELLASVVILLFGLAFNCVAQTPTPTPTADDDSLVHYGDVIDVDFLGTFEYDWRGTLEPDGSLNGLDELAGPIPAICRAETAIAADIEKAYGKILRSPNVKVRIVDRSGRAVVRLDGAVRTPTRFRLQRTVKLRELIVLSGGFTDALSGEIKILRPGELNCSGSRDNSLQVITIQITDLIAGVAGADPVVLSGDSVEVVRADPVYVIGAVANPRPVAMKPDLTVSRAVASAGGLAKDADGRVTIFRRQNGETTAIEGDLSRIKRGEMVDTVLMPFDIIDVAGKGAQARKFPPIASSINQPSDKRELPLRVVD